MRHGLWTADGFAAGGLRQNIGLFVENLLS
jgi:hypothetical protein